MRQRKNRKLIRFDSATKIVNISEHDLEFNSRTLYFLRIIRHLADESFDKQIVSTFATADLGALEEVIGNLDDLFAANPTKSVALITVLSSRLNDISDDFTTGEADDVEIESVNERMAAVNLKGTFECTHREKSNSNIICNQEC